MKKYILEYYAGNPDTMSEYEDYTDKGVEKFKDYSYVYPDEQKWNSDDDVEAGDANVIWYINSHDQHVSPTDIKMMNMDIKNSCLFPEWMVDIVREYNTPNSKLADKTAKLGNMTIAQYKFINTSRRKRT